MKARTAPSSHPVPRQSFSRRAAMRFVVLIGIVSLFADMAHEGARGITGPFLATLGANAAIVAGIAGFGELLGYTLRLFFGYATDRSGRYWPIAFLGYGVQLVCVPLLALAGNWPVAAALMIGERVGRAMRIPTRDAMIAHASGELGSGWVFGVREALDAAGGMLGPLLVAAVVFLSANSYRPAFAVLAVPVVLTWLCLVGAQRLYPHPQELEAPPTQIEPTGYPRVFWVYLLAMGLIALAYADYPLIAFHFSKAGIFSPDVIPLLYAVAMGTEVLASLAIGRLFDRVGLLTVIVITLFTAFFAPFVFLGNAPLAVLGMILWGLGMAAQESVVKAAVTGMVASTRRATAYGLFDTGFGIFWFVGSVALGLLYDSTIVGLVIFSVVLQLLAIPIFFWVYRALRRTSVGAAA